VFFVFFGVFMNWVLFLFLPDLCNISREGLSLFPYLTKVASDCTLGFIVGLLFLVGFPAGFVFLGYKYSLQNAIQYSYVKNKDTFYKYFSTKMLSFVEKKQSGNAGVMQLAGNFLEKLDNVPWAMRAVINFFKDKIPFVELLEKISVNTEISADNSEEVANRLAQDADTYIKDELLKPDTTLIWGLVLINVGLFVLLKWILV
ncbi:MAG: hypothetical protein ACPGVB_13565, partial [Chitinophagales bacterium]